MNRIHVAGISYRTAALDVRERVACTAAALPARLDTARGVGGCEEVVVVSTCNRTEAYVSGEPGDARAALLAGCDATGLAPEHVFVQSGPEAVRHLFRVSASLDSMVPGESQVLGQVRRAYEAARTHGTVGRRLHGLFQRAIKVGREVRAEAGLAAIRSGVAETAASHAEDVLGSLGGKKLLCIGTGKMNRLLLRHFHSRAPSGRPAGVAVLGRDAEKAARFAADFGGDGGLLELLPMRLGEADLIVCGTGSTRPIVSEAVVRAAMRGREDRPLFIIDLALPRDVDAAVSRVANVHLYDLDDLQAAAETAAGGRRSELTVAERMVEEHVQRFISWQQGRQLGPMIDRLYQQGHAAAEGELERFRGKLPESMSEGDKDQVAAASEEMARRLVNKLLHAPVSSLRDMPDPERHATYRHAVEKLFRLDEE